MSATESRSLCPGATNRMDGSLYESEGNRIWIAVCEDGLLSIRIAHLDIVDPLAHDHPKGPGEGEQLEELRRERSIKGTAERAEIKLGAKRK
jgi:hypothetical protein